MVFITSKLAVCGIINNNCTCKMCVCIHVYLQGRRNRGGRGGGASAPPLWKQGGLSPPFFHNPILQKVQQHSSVIICRCLQKSARVKIATKSVQKLLPECIRNALRESKIPKFSGGACPQAPLGGLWSYAYSLTAVTVKCLSPPTFVTCSPPLTCVCACASMKDLYNYYVLIPIGLHACTPSIVYIVHKYSFLNFNHCIQLIVQEHNVIDQQSKNVRDHLRAYYSTNMPPSAEH